LALSARSATAFGRPFASRHGSRLFTLRLFFAHRPAVPFSTSPAWRKVFTCPAQTSCPSRLECSLCPAFRRLSLSGVSLRKPPESFVPCWCAVTTDCPLGNCDSPKGRNRPCATSLDWKRLLIASRRAGSIRVSDSARTPSEEPVNPASPLAARAIKFQRDRANQPGPIFPRSPGIICEMLVELSFRVAISFLGNIARESPNLLLTGLSPSMAALSRNLLLGW
jgi:hypothetical protein